MKHFCKINNGNMATIMFGKTISQNSFQANVKGDEIIHLPDVANGTYIISLEEISGERIETIRLNIFR